MLKQLVAYVGLERFLQPGLRELLPRTLSRQCQLDDLLAALEKGLGPRFLSSGAKQWLKTTGLNACGRFRG